MRIVFLGRCLVIAFLFLVFAGHSQNTLTLKKGVVIDSLKIPGTNNHFSIYLPQNFDMNKSWPLLLGFDSKGRTTSLARLYREAAEEFGYIVAISDFLENQSLKEKSEHIPVFLEHIVSLFPIQQGRVYVTGIDKDAELMSLVPVFYNSKIFGVVAIGSSHYYGSRIKIGKNFSYFGVLNINNYRYKDFLKNAEYLKRKAIPADILTYDGKSEYPYPKLLKKPLSTFTLQAMLKGRMPKDSIWVNNLFQKELEQVDIDLKKGRFLYALEEVKRIRKKYHLFFDTKNLREKEKQIKRFKGYKKERRLQLKYINQENYYRESYMFLMQEDVAEKKYENLGWWQHQMAELDSLKKKKEKHAVAMVSRIKGFLKNLAKNSEINLSNKPRDFEKKMFLNILRTIIDKKDYDSYFNIISLSTKDQDYETALFYLERLLENGFKDMDALYNIEGTLPLRITKEYNQLIKKHLGSSKYDFSK